MDTFNSFEELARANEITQVVSQIGRDVTFDTLLNGDTPPAAMSCTSANESADDQSVWNMGEVATFGR